MKTYGILVAGGSGSRLGHELPKALVPVGGQPLFVWALDAMLEAGNGELYEHIVVVAPRTCEELFAPHCENPRVSQCPGGRSRQESVWHGLTYLNSMAQISAAKHDNTTVLVHDAARAMTPQAVHERVAATINSGAAACIPVLPVKDSLRTTAGAAVDRSEYVAVQTPQGFDAPVLFAAHQAGLGLAFDESTSATDDASLTDLTGVPVNYVSGDEASMKVTTPLDLAVMAALVNSRQP